MAPMSERRVPRWDALVPDRWSWLYLLATPTSYLLVLATIVTLIAKLPVVRGLHGIGWWPAQWASACAVDVAFFLAIAALLALGEHVSRRLLIATLPLALLVTAVAVINACYLAISGEQLTWPVFMLGLQRFGDVKGIVGATVFVGPLGALVLLVLVLGPPGLVLHVLRRAGRPLGVVANGISRARAAGACAAVAALVVLLAPTPRHYALGRLHVNAVWRTYWGLATGNHRWNGVGGTFAGYRPRELVDAETIAATRTRARPNVVMIVLESTRRDELTLDRPDAPARTPNLVALAARGLDFTQARSVIPQTSKSVWSMLCGRLPILETVVFETSTRIDVQCVPEILDRAGWRTGFFQSAAGWFEDRPRLVAGLGFAEFLSAEHVTTELLGYLGSEEDTLVAPLARWLDAAPGAPFFATVLTSATHHPYDLSPAHVQRLDARGAPHGTDRERYDRQIEAADRLLGDVVTLLAERHQLDHTIIVVAGDHGEGFGDKGVRQHGSNFFEESLRVPLVIAGPGVPARRDAHAATLVDVAPTLLEALGIPVQPAAAAATHARSLLHGAPPDRVLPFACYYDNACRGFVRGRTKVVFIPETGQAFHYDLDADPDEASPRPLSDELAARLAEVQDQIDAHRTPRWKSNRAAMDRFGRWRCPADRPCQPIDRLAP